MSKEPPKETELERRLRERAEAEDRAAETHVSTEADPAPDDTPEPSAEAYTALQEECESLRDQLLRSRAEIENYRKRTAREVERIRKTAAESLIHDLLAVMDNLELALRNAESESGPMIEGVRLVHKQFIDTLTRNGLEPIEALGKPFDPNFHEAVAQAPSNEVEPDHVIEEYQRGYRLGGQILRPSKVLVSQRADAAKGA
jgi:molecular chaperone GrpE